MVKKPISKSIDLSGLTKTQMISLIEQLDAYDDKLRYNKLDQWFPESGPYAREYYPKNVDFFNAGRKYKERVLFGGNRTGKSTTAAYEVALHLTGRYPEWWDGKRFHEPVKVICAGDTHGNVRDIAQFLLLGERHDIGSGMIPKQYIVEGSVKPKPNVTNGIDEALIKHISGYNSTVRFKSYDAGRKSFQGTNQHVIWLDEEPDDSEIYEEANTRTMTTAGIVLTTFTPLSGLSNVVLSFLPGGRFPAGNVVPGFSRYIELIGWEDVPHLPEEEKKALLATYSSHTIEARTKGIPSIGFGKVFTTMESNFVVPSFPIPHEWPKVYGFDPGYIETAVVWAAMDPNTKCVYIYDEFVAFEGKMLDIAYGIKRRGDWMKGVIDPSTKNHDTASRVRFTEYKDLGLHIYLADNSVEAGISLIQTALDSGLFKVMAHCHRWIYEYRLYRRDKHGSIEKHQRDDCLDATRYIYNTGLKYLTVQPDEFNLMLSAHKHRAESKRNRDPITGC